MINLFIILGWIGMFFLISAHFLISFKKIKLNSKLFHILNLLGGSGILFSTIPQRFYPVIILNFFWIVISLISLINIMKIKPVYKDLR